MRSLSVLGAVAVLASAGCFSVSRDYPVRELYGLDPLKARPGEGVPHLPVLRVVPVRVASPFDGGFVYRTADVKYTIDYYRGFVTTPDRLLTQEALRYLDEARVARSVVEAHIQIESPLVLETSVVELYGDYRDPAHPAAVLRARFMLLEDGAAGARIVGDWTDGATVALEGTDASALARALGHAWDRLLERLADELRRVSTG